MSGSAESISQLSPATQANLTDLLPVTQGSTGPGTGTSRKITIAQLIAQAPNGLAQGAMQLQWASGGVVFPGVIYFTLAAPMPGTITSFIGINLTPLSPGTANFTVSISIGGTPITGLQNIALNNGASETVVTATGNNQFTLGQAITATISGVTGAPTNSVIMLQATFT